MVCVDVGMSFATNAGLNGTRTNRLALLVANVLALVIMMMTTMMTLYILAKRICVNAITMKLVVVGVTLKTLLITNPQCKFF